MPVGPTAEELRDTLCLFQPGIEDMGGEPEADLHSQVQTVLRETLKTVKRAVHLQGAGHRAILSRSEEGRRLRRSDREAGRTLSDDVLDRALLQRHPPTHGAHRRGYVRYWPPDMAVPGRMAGPPGRARRLSLLRRTERPPDRPARARLLHLLHPAFEPPRFRDDHKPDEVFFRLKGLDDAIRRHLSFYAAAQDLASTASGGAKSIYLDKAKDALRDMSRWLQEKQMAAYEVTSQGRPSPCRSGPRGSRFATRRGSDPRNVSTSGRGEHHLRHRAKQPVRRGGARVSHLLGAGDRIQPEATRPECAARAGRR